MRLNTDPIQLSRQVRDTKRNLLGQMNDQDAPDASRLVGRVGLMAFPPFMTTIAGELHHGTSPLVLGTAVAELIGQMLATTVETLVEDTDHAPGLINLIDSAGKIAARIIINAAATKKAEVLKAKETTVLHLVEDTKKSPANIVHMPPARPRSG